LHLRRSRTKSRTVTVAFELRPTSIPVRNRDSDDDVALRSLAATRTSVDFTEDI
jgi:hypothetical protein